LSSQFRGSFHGHGSGKRRESHLLMRSQMDLMKNSAPTKEPMTEKIRKSSTPQRSGENEKKIKGRPCKERSRAEMLPEKEKKKQVERGIRKVRKRGRIRKGGSQRFARGLGMLAHKGTHGPPLEEAEGKLGKEKDAAH